MIDEIKRQVTSLKILTALLIIAVSIYLIQILWGFFSNFSDVFVIMLSAWLLSFILEPLVEKICSYFKVSRLIAGIAVYIFFLGLLVTVIFFFIPVIIKQVQQLMVILPKYLSNAPAITRRWGDVLTSYLGNSLPIISSVAGIFFDIFLVIIISFYLVVDRAKISAEVIDLTPKKWRGHLNFIASVIDTTFASFLRVQLIFGLLTGITAWIVLRLFNVDFASFTALMSGILAVIPLIGPILAIIPPLMVPLLTDTTQALFVFISLLAIQQVIFNVIGPRLMSRAFNLHPVVVLLSFLIGSKIAGGVGAIFAVPVLGILTIVFHQVSHHFLRERS